MAKALFLTGEKKVGKTTAVRKIVASLGEGHFAGFYATERRENGLRTGFGISLLDGREGMLAAVDSDSELRVGRVIDGRVKYGVELGFLEEVAIPAVTAALNDHPGKLLLIDEIGPMQLYSRAFRQFVLDVLDSSRVVLGTIMSLSDPWVDALKSRDDMETFLLTVQNRTSMAEMVTWYLSREIGVPCQESRSDRRVRGTRAPG